MSHLVSLFEDLPADRLADAGGKGAMLARLAQSGYQVPNGFVVFPAAFDDNALSMEARFAIIDRLTTLRVPKGDVSFAVRSSALAEDSANASFAGQFETVLNVTSNEAVLDAVRTVFESGSSERVRAYSETKGVDAAHRIAVVVQVMVQADLSGVLFTADPLTGSVATMTGNYVHGLAEQLVSGTADAQAFTLQRPKGRYDGPTELTRYARALFDTGRSIEANFGGPQDIEWAIANHTLYVLQARPITTLITEKRETYEINDSLAGDFIWSNTNIGEAMPGVFTPLSWSLLRMLDKAQERLPGHFLFSGNIAGRLYTNASLLLSLGPLVGKTPASLVPLFSDVFASLPDGMEIPVYPFDRWSFAHDYAGRIAHRVKMLAWASSKLRGYLETNPRRLDRLRVRINRVRTGPDLVDIWSELHHLNILAMWSNFAGSSKLVMVYRLQNQLFKLVDTEDANALLSRLGGDEGLASAGPVLGMSKLLDGTLSKEEYLVRYGHRSPTEYEISTPDANEDPEWLDTRIREYKDLGVSPSDRLILQDSRYQDALHRFNQRYPEKAAWLRRNLKTMAEAARGREAYRSEWVRTFRVNRAFALKAAEMTGLGDNIFYLYIDEVLAVLKGNLAPLDHIKARKATVERYRALPPLPSLIRGRFDPFQWAKDSNRRMDVYDPTLPEATPDGDQLKGYAGAAGKVEGVVRVLAGPDEAKSLLTGEILVTTTTNVGWTPLFPRAAAIVTDIGAPLSHAAIVARELGIPAVVGVGNATTRLKTGDRVVVDGGRGTVTLLHEPE